VFDRFRQADASSTRSYRGLGLGLAIVRHILDLHGGTVDASSGGEGKGAAFRVTLPVAPIAGRLPSAAVGPVATGAGGAAVGGAGSASSATGVAGPGATIAGTAASTSGGAAADGARLAGVRVLVVDDDLDSRELLEHVTAVFERGRRDGAVSSSST
jgi:hypothetical protein